MKCPRCNNGDTKVLESRQNQEGHSVRRRRHCQLCAYRFTTYEKEEDLTFQVRKKEGHFEEFNRQKLIRAISTACRKRQVLPDRIESLVALIEFRLREAGERIVDSSRIGELVLAELRTVDPVAYVRFASIYKEFHDPEQFIHELDALNQSNF